MGQPGCFGSAIRGLDTRQEEGKNSRDCLKILGMEVLEVSSAAQLAESQPDWEAAGGRIHPRDLLARWEDGPQRASREVSLLICFVFRPEVRGEGERKKNSPTLPLGKREATSDKTVIH